MAFSFLRNAVHLTSIRIMRLLSALDANDEAEARQGGGEGQGEVRGHTAI